MFAHPVAYGGGLVVRVFDGHRGWPASSRQTWIRFRPILKEVPSNKPPLWWDSLQQENTPDSLKAFFNIMGKHDGWPTVLPYLWFTSPPPPPPYPTLTFSVNPRGDLPPDHPPSNPPSSADVRTIHRQFHAPPASYVLGGLANIFSHRAL